MVNVGITAGLKDLGGNGDAVSDGIGVSVRVGVKVFVDEGEIEGIILLGVEMNEFSATG